jgi:hypothetical protein
MRCPVLRPRCWSGRKRIFSARSNAQRKTASAFDDVQTAPPFRPQNALMSALEFMYVIGRIRPPPSISASASQQSSTCSIVAMSAIEHPALRSGRSTCCFGPVRMSAVSAMKWTPQKTMNSASSTWDASTERPYESPVRSANW